MSESELRSDDDIEAILKIAVSQAGGIEAQTLRERLMASASELGLTSEQVAAAESKWAAEEKERRDLAEFTAMRKRAFWGRASTVAVLSVFLIAANLFDDRSVDWAPWIVLILGVQLAMRAIGTFFPNSERFQRRYQKWRLTRDDRLAREDRRDHF